VEGNHLMRLTQHHSSGLSPQTADDLLRPPLENYSTTLLIAELARRGVFRSVPELPVDDDPIRSFNSADGEGDLTSRSRPCAASARPLSPSRGQSSGRVRPALRLPD
jgi:hypothetical protein